MSRAKPSATASKGSLYAIDVATTIALYTEARAALGREGELRGTLAPGHLADLVAFPSNPFTCAVDDLRLRPVLTIVGGRVVHPRGHAVRRVCALGPRVGSERKVIFVTRGDRSCHSQRGDGQEENRGADADK